MFFDVLALAIVVGGCYLVWQDRRRLVPPVLPPEDLPPAAATSPLPRHGRLGGYVADGLTSIDEFLAGPGPGSGSGPGPGPGPGRDRDRDQPA
jgi:hypothetical protein